jgi:hypothetical protein
LSESICSNDDVAGLLGQQLRLHLQFKAKIRLRRGYVEVDRFAGSHCKRIRLDRLAIRPLSESSRVTVAASSIGKMGFSIGLTCCTGWFAAAA